MKRIILIIALICLAGCVNLYAQEGVTPVNLDASTNGDTIDGVSPQSVYLYDDGGPGANGNPGYYNGGHDYIIHVTGDCESLDSLNHLTVVIKEYDILCHDTLYIYDGGSINSPLLTKINNCYASNSNSAYSISSTNTEKMLTIRFRSTIDTTNSAKGFHLVFQCQRACEKVVAYIENQFERTDMRGNVISALKTKQVPDQFDTLFVKDTVTVYDTV
jgi:hypothetical protein